MKNKRFRPTLPAAGFRATATTASPKDLRLRLPEAAVACQRAAPGSADGARGDKRLEQSVRSDAPDRNVLPGCYGPVHGEITHS